MLESLLAKHLANGFADFAGLHIEGSVPVKQDLINAVIADVLTNGLPASPPKASSGGEAVVKAGAASGLSLDPETIQTLVRQLVKRAEITAENGAITLHFEVRR